MDLVFAVKCILSILPLLIFRHAFMEWQDALWQEHYLFRESSSGWKETVLGLTVLLGVFCLAVIWTYQP